MTMITAINSSYNHAFPSSITFAFISHDAAVCWRRSEHSSNCIDYRYIFRIYLCARQGTSRSAGRRFFYHSFMTIMDDVNGNGICRWARLLHVCTFYKERFLVSLYLNFVIMGFVLYYHYISSSNLLTDSILFLLTFSTDRPALYWRHYTSASNFNERATRQLNRIIAASTNALFFFSTGGANLQICPPVFELILTRTPPSILRLTLANPSSSPMFFARRNFARWVLPVYVHVVY